MPVSRSTRGHKISRTARTLIFGSTAIFRTPVSSFGRVPPNRRSPTKTRAFVPLLYSRFTLSDEKIPPKCPSYGQRVGLVYSTGYSIGTAPPDGTRRQMLCSTVATPTLGTSVPEVKPKLPLFAVGDTEAKLSLAFAMKAGYRIVLDGDGDALITNPRGRPTTSTSSSATVRASESAATPTTVGVSMKSG